MGEISRKFCDMAGVLFKDEAYGICLREKQGVKIFEFDARKAAADREPFLRETRALLSEHMDPESYAAAFMIQYKKFPDDTVATMFRSLDQEMLAISNAPEINENMRLRMYQLGGYQSDLLNHPVDRAGVIYDYARKEAVNLTVGNINEQLDNPADITDGITLGHRVYGPLRSIALDPEMNIANWFTYHTGNPVMKTALSEAGLRMDDPKQFSRLNPAFGKTFAPGAEDEFRQMVKWHEEAHASGRKFGLQEPGADYYAFVRMRQEYPGPETNALIRYVSDMRALHWLDGVESIKPGTMSYGAGTMLAAEAALELTPAQLAAMDDEETVRQGAQFDSYSDDRAPTEFLFGNMVRTEIDNIVRAQGSGPGIGIMKQAVDNLTLDKMPDDIAGDPRALKIWEKTREKFSGALERLADRIGEMKTSGEKTQSTPDAVDKPATAPPAGPGM